jgi:hypothetical protein
MQLEQFRIGIFNWLSLTIVTWMLATSLVSAQPTCLPESVFEANVMAQFPVTNLGYINNVLTACVYEKADDPYVDKLIGCWTVDPTTGVLGASAASGIPGYGRRTALDANSCIDGYCIAPIPEDPDVVKTFFAASTDGAHAAILTPSRLYVFAVSTKARVAEIELSKPGAADDTNIGNEAFGLLYSGDTLFVFGADAGPFIGVWVFKEDGTRAGRVTATTAAGSKAVNVFFGGYGILGHDKVALADAGLQNLTIVTGANAAKQSTKRSVSYAPCSEDQFEKWARFESMHADACRRTLDAKYKPYIDVSPLQLPSGDIITALSGPAQGYLAVLRPADLSEKYRLKLVRCP